MGWTQEVARLAQGEVVAIDGKTVRRSHDRSRGQQAIHLVSAWASANSMTLGQVKVERKSNEITAIPKLLGLLALHGCIVTIDAMRCQREIAEQIVEAGADYVLAVKENQGQLNDDVRDPYSSLSTSPGRTSRQPSGTSLFPAAWRVPVSITPSHPTG